MDNTDWTGVLSLFYMESICIFNIIFVEKEFIMRLKMHSVSGRGDDLE